MTPISSAYDYYLSTYGAQRASRYDSHKKEELRNIVNRIKKLNKESPLYKLKTSKDVQKFAIDIKESARSIQNVVAAFSEDEKGIGAAFQKKIATSSNPDAVTAEYTGSSSSFSTDEANDGFQIEVLQLAAPQTNIGNFLKRDAYDLPPGSYSFDLNLNKNSYEFQYNINTGDTNEDILHKLARLVNNSQIGLKADLLVGSQDMVALRLESKQTGLSPEEEAIFKIVPENSPESQNTMEILGIDAVSAAAENSIFLLNGREHSSYSNTFTINNVFSVTLNGVTEKNKPVVIGFKSGSEAVTDDVQLLVDSFNSMLETAERHSGTKQSNEKLLADMGNIAKAYSPELDPMGLSVSDIGLITVDREKLTESVESEQADEHIDVLNHFKDAIGRKADEASLDPMNYVKKMLVAYKNPNSNKNFVCPYISSVYSGMMVDRVY